MEGNEVYGRHGDGEVLRRLDAYAASRLAPTPEAVRRTRAALMAQAHRQAALRAADDARMTAAPLTRRSARPPVRRVGATLAAAAVGLALAAGTVAAANPGGPLYGARLWTEALILPSDARARAEAQLDRLDARLAEIRAAGTDPAASLSALRAYGEIAAQLAATLDETPGSDAWVVERWSRHVEVLRALAASVPMAARPTLEQALDRSRVALDRLDDRRRTPPAPGTSQPGVGPGTPAERPVGPASPRPRERPEPTKPGRAGATAPPGQSRSSPPSSPAP